MQVMVTGSRGWTDVEMIRERLASLPDDAVVMEGGATGADRIAHVLCVEQRREVRTFLPDMDLPSPARYHIRNDEMLGYADLVLAFHDGDSRGTASVIAKARQRGIPVEVLT